MANFFRSAGDLIDWLRQRGSATAAAEAVINIPGVDKRHANDVAEITRRIFSNRDVENAAETLLGILRTAGVTEAGAKEGVERSDAAVAADALLAAKRIGKDDHARMIREANIFRQPGQYPMALRMCPKLPWSVGNKLVSTYNCRHYCLDSMVLDDDPERVYCLEALWRQHVAHKFYREWLDRKTGKYVGGFVNDRFHVFPDAGTPASGDKQPRDGGNPMGLKPDERTRQPRPHEYSTERRLQEQRDPGSTKSITLNASVAEQIVRSGASAGAVRVAASDLSGSDDPVFEAFSTAADLRMMGVADDEAVARVSDGLGIDLGRAARIQQAAAAAFDRHQSDVYEAEIPAKTSVHGKVRSALDQDAVDSGLVGDETA